MQEMESHGLPVVPPKPKSSHATPGPQQPLELSGDVFDPFRCKSCDHCLDNNSVEEGSRWLLH